MSATDHAEIARVILEHGTVVSAETEALVHATLALVEQQRIANIIALADHAHSRFGNYAGVAGGMGGLFSYGETPESSMRVRDDIQAVLGL